MSTGGNWGRPLRRRNVFGATLLVALVVVSLFTLGSASARTQASSSLASTSSSSAAQQAAVNGSVSTSGAGASSVGGGVLASIAGCGADGTIADASGFEDADGNLAIDTPGCMDWNGFTPTWTGTAPSQQGTASNNWWTFVGVIAVV